MKLGALFQQLADFDTALLANTVGYLDATPTHEWYMGGSVQSMTPTIGPVVGVAMTCEIDSSSPGGIAGAEPYYQLLEAIEECPEPVILVIKAAGSRPDHECVLGDGMAKMLHSVGCVGAVTDGGVRDIEGILTVPFSVHARGRTVHHGALRYSRVNQPVFVGGITVSPGEIIHANAGGVIKLPRKGLERLPALATEMRAFEHAAHCVFRRTDLTIAEKRRALDELLAKGSFGPGRPG
jgi:4-hydroxy-4-methyl-2-oxoglutarate aldolase